MKTITAIILSTTFLFATHQATAQITEIDRTVLLSDSSSCAVIGDSIALGIYLNMQECSGNAKVGINTAQDLYRLPNRIAAHNVYVSLGVNDGANANTKGNLQTIRKRITATRVTWILPNAKYSAQRAAVQAVAAQYGDQTKAVDQYASTDGIHPTLAGYKQIAHELNNGE